MTFQFVGWALKIYLFPFSVHEKNTVKSGLWEYNLKQIFIDTYFFVTLEVKHLIIHYYL